MHDDAVKTRARIINTFVLSISAYNTGAEVGARIEVISGGAPVMQLLRLPEHDGSGAHIALKHLRRVNRSQSLEIMYPM